MKEGERERRERERDREREREGERERERERVEPSEAHTDGLFGQVVLILIIHHSSNEKVHGV